MPEDAPRPVQAAIRTELGAIFVSLELSRRTWLIASLSPGGGEKMSKHSAPAGEVCELRRFAEVSRQGKIRPSAMPR
jgi:transposase